MTVLKNGVEQRRSSKIILIMPIDCMALLRTRKVKKALVARRTARIWATTKLHLRQGAHLEIRKPWSLRREGVSYPIFIQCGFRIVKTWLHVRLRANDQPTKPLHVNVGVTISKKELFKQPRETYAGLRSIWFGPGFYIPLRNNTEHQAVQVRQVT